MLCVAAGQGRNAVYLAERGHPVTAVDRSAVGLADARRLAGERGVAIETVVADLALWDPGLDRWDGIISTFAHMPPEARAVLHRRLVPSLRPGGALILEAYSARQVEYDTGGPPEAELLMTLDALQAEFDGLILEHAAELERDVVEGSRHTGAAHVVQIVGRRAVVGPPGE